MATTAATCLQRFELQYTRKWKIIRAQLLLLHTLAYAKTQNSTDFRGSNLIAKLARTTTPDAYAVMHHALVYYKHSFCSGSVISSRVVLTVASCFNIDDEKTAASEISVKVGCSNYQDEGDVFGVAEKKEHEFFRYKSKLNNDIALLLLKSHVRFDKSVRKVLLAEPATVVPAMSYIVVMGWGTDVTRSQENTVIKSNMIVLDKEDCVDVYEGPITQSMFCAKYEIDHRLSDNGGAALYKGLVVGISSYGAFLEEPPFIALFTNVTYFYKWIKLNTEKLLIKYCSEEVQEDSSSLQQDYAGSQFFR